MGQRVSEPTTVVGILGVVLFTLSWGVLLPSISLHDYGSMLLVVFLWPFHMLLMLFLLRSTQKLFEFLLVSALWLLCNCCTIFVVVCDTFLCKRKVVLCSQKDLCVEETPFIFVQKKHFWCCDL